MTSTVLLNEWIVKIELVSKRMQKGKKRESILLSPCEPRETWREQEKDHA